MSSSMLTFQKSYLLICYTAYLSCLPHGSENFSSFFIYESVGATDPQDMANLDLRGMVGKIYAGDH